MKKKRKGQKCKTCGKELKLTEIPMPTKTWWAYMCGCDELVREAKRLQAQRAKEGGA